MNRGEWCLLLSMLRILAAVACLCCAGGVYGQRRAASELTVEQSLQLSGEMLQANDIREATYYLNVAAEKCWDAKDYSKAIEYYSKSAELNEAILNWNGIAGINCNIGLIYYDMGDYENSYRYLQMTYQYRKEQGELVSVISALINMSVTLNKMERYRDAIAVLDEALTAARDMNDYQQMKSCYGMLSETYTKAGDTEKASDYFHMFKAVHDDLMSESEERHASELAEAAYKTQLAETERQLAEARQWIASRELTARDLQLAGMDSVNRELLENKSKAELMIDNFRAGEEIAELQRKEIEAQLKQEQMTRNSLIAVLCVVLLGIAVTVFFFLQKRRDNRKLMAANEKLTRIQKELAEYQEKLEEIVVVRTSKLRTALDKAHESDRLKASFFANLSHEIRTPLNAILGFSKMLDSPNISPEKRIMMTGIVQSNAVQLMQMVEDIVLLSEIDSDLVSIQPQKCSLHELLTRVITDADEMLIISGRIKLEVLLDNRFPLEKHGPVFIDGRRVRLVLMHLINNAIKHTERGYVMLGCEVIPDEKLLRFRVEDTGNGIDEDDFESLFVRFWKKGDPHTQKFRGLGIGLSLCKELVGLMNGKFTVSSKPGHGSTFCFTVSYH